VFACDKAIYRIVPRGTSLGLDELAKTIRRGPGAPPLTGTLSCPRGCGARISWALAAHLGAYREEFLMFLSQELSWTRCPEHRGIQRQLDTPPDRDWTYLPPAASIVGGGPRYVNSYE
jgi:hypothetical protein